MGHGWSTTDVVTFDQSTHSAPAGLAGSIQEASPDSRV